MTRRVMPREAMEAEQEPTRFMVKMPDGPKLPYNSSEFASAFVDADLFDAVLTAARDMPGCDQGASGDGTRPTYCFTCHESLPCSGDDLRTALRAYDEGQAQ